MATDQGTLGLPGSRRDGQVGPAGGRGCGPHADRLRRRRSDALRPSACLPIGHALFWKRSSGSGSLSSSIVRRRRTRVSKSSFPNRASSPALAHALPAPRAAREASPSGRLPVRRRLPSTNGSRDTLAPHTHRTQRVCTWRRSKVKRRSSATTRWRPPRLPRMMRPRGRSRASRERGRCRRSCSRGSPSIGITNARDWADRSSRMASSVRGSGGGDRRTSSARPCQARRGEGLVHPVRLRGVTDRSASPADAAEGRSRVPQAAWNRVVETVSPRRRGGLGAARSDGRAVRCGRGAS